MLPASVLYKDSNNFTVLFSEYIVSMKIPEICSGVQSIQF